MVDKQSTSIYDLTCCYEKQVVVDYLNVRRIIGLAHLSFKKEPFSPPPTDFVCVRG